MELHDLPNCKKLLCKNNQLLQLPDLPKCEELCCSNNHIKKLPVIDKCEILLCNNNEISFLPILPLCSHTRCLLESYARSYTNFVGCRNFNCNNNPLPFFDHLSYEKLRKFQTFYLSLKYFRLMYKRMLTIKSNKRQSLHDELKYSPDLPFYKNDEYYKNFIDLQKSLLI